MDFKSNYPYVFVNGLTSYGPDSKLDEYSPFFGSREGKITEYLADRGLEVYEAPTGPFSSAWDRACELYAILTGTTVDYGAAHSERFGHKRFGRTYTHPLFEGWGQKTADGKIKKVNLVGHSFGGTTIRLLACLLDKGCDAEKAATNPSEISPLFTGGKAKWIFSITTCATPHNGMTFFDAFGAMGDLFKTLVFRGANAIANTPLSMMYDFKLDQFDLTSDPYSKFKVQVDPAHADEVMNSKDNAFYDLSVKGAEEVNEHLYCVPDIYYFSYASKKTKKAAIGNNQVAIKGTYFPYKITCAYIGCYDIDLNRGIKLDSKWFENDGMVNTYSAVAPFNEPATDFNMVTSVRPGIWNKMGIMDMIHSDFCGHHIKLEKIGDFYLKNAEGINNIEDKD